MPLDEIKARRRFLRRARGAAQRSMCRRRCPIRSPMRMRGDLDLDPAMWEKAGVRRRARRPCWCRRRSCRADGAADHAHLRPAEPCRADRVSRRQDRSGDATPLAAALREADEEIGLDARLIEPIGYLDLYLTFSGYRILPAVARVKPRLRAHASTRPKSPTPSRCRSPS